MNYLLYGHNGSANHGCEAIIRGSAALLGNPSFVLSTAPCEDYKYGINALSTVEQAISDRTIDYSFLRAYIRQRLFHDYTEMDGLAYRPAIRKAADTTSVALSAGGDNYCYSNPEFYGYLNKLYKRCGFATVLWGCSIEPTVVAQKKISQDLARYNLIVARESITYEAVKHVQENTVLAPDPAFFMEPKECTLDDRLKTGNVIGINASPHILKCESESGMTYDNYKQLIQHILSETDATVALIPHVVWESNDDRKVLQQLYDEFEQNTRLVLVEDHTAPELKYIISKCSFFVGARTHATIAAYSSCVPTLVVGYSVKARGIARDLFGTEEGYVLPVQELANANQLMEAFCLLYAKKNQIAAHLNKLLPDYLASAQPAVVAINELE